MKLEVARRLLQPLVIRLHLLVSRAIVKLVDDSLKMQALQLNVLADDSKDGVERFQEYGFTSVPFPGAEAVVLSVGGSREHLVVVAVDDRRYRLKGLETGEVALYTDEGTAVHLKRGNLVEIESEEVIINGKLHVKGAVEMDDTLFVNGSITSDGDIASSGDVQDYSSTMNAMRGKFNVHTHVETQSITDPPKPQM